MDGDLRTYSPSARRREELRRRGIVPVGAPLTAAAALVAGFVVACAIAGSAAQDVGAFAREAFAHCAGAADGPPAQDAAARALRLALRCVAPVALAAWLAALVAHNVQTRFLLTLPGGRPDAHSGGDGGRRRAFRAPRFAPLHAAGGLGLLAAIYIGRFLRAAATGDGVIAIAATEHGVAGFVVAALAFLVAFGFTASAYERWRYERAIMMTRREWLRELRETEGHQVTRTRRARRRRAKD